jgi:hypothetical protein
MNTRLEIILETVKILIEDSYEEERKKFWEKMKAMDAEIEAGKQRLDASMSGLISAHTKTFERLSGKDDRTPEEKAETKRSVDAQVELAQIEGRKQANAGGKANVDIRTGKRKYPIDTGRFGIEHGQLVDRRADLDDTRTIGQRLAYDKNTQAGLNAQMDAAKQREIDRRNAKRRELGMPELNPNSPEMTGRRFTFDRSRLSDPVYRQEAIRQANDTRSPYKKRQDREIEQMLDAVRRGGQSKQDAISRFNQSLDDLRRKEEILKKDLESSWSRDPNAAQEKAERKEREHQELLQDPRMAAAADRVQAKLDARFGKGKVSIR